MLYVLKVRLSSGYTCLFVDIYVCVCVPVCLRESKVTSPQTVSRPSTPELTLRITVTGGGSGGRWFAEMLLDLWTETSHSFGSDVSLLTSNFSYANPCCLYSSTVSDRYGPDLP